MSETKTEQPAQQQETITIDPNSPGYRSIKIDFDIETNQIIFNLHKDVTPGQVTLVIANLLSMTAEKVMQTEAMVGQMIAQQQDTNRIIMPGDPGYMVGLGNNPKILTKH
jgi:hypothetical protein